MASFPGYYLTNVALRVNLPMVETHDADMGEERGDISLETDGGKRYTYNQFKREKRRFTFHCVSQAQLDAFRTMHTTVQGQTLPFYFVDSDGVTMYCKKQKDFMFRRIKAPGFQYDVVLELTEEPADAAIGT
jgi:hypothetical protein